MSGSWEIRPGLWVWVVLLVVWGCGPGAEGQAPAQAARSGVEASGGVAPDMVGADAGGAVGDGAVRSVAAASDAGAAGRGDVGQGARVSRIVSFSPGLTEIAFEVGLGPKVVGVSTFDVYPPEVASLARVGGMMDPNLEKTLALRPDLILSAPSVRGIPELAREKQIAIVQSSTDSLADVFQAYGDIGRAGGVEADAQAALSRLKGRLEALRAPQDGPRPKVLLVIGRDQGALTGLYAAGPGAFLDELLEIAGGRNALPASVGKWPRVGLEGLLAHPPDLILEFEAREGDAAASTLKAREAWRRLDSLEAAREGRIHVLTGDHLLLPGPRLVQTVEGIRAALGQPR